MFFCCSASAAFWAQYLEFSLPTRIVVAQRIALTRISPFPPFARSPQ